MLQLGLVSKVRSFFMARENNFSRAYLVKHLIFKILGAIWRITKVRHFLIPLSVTFLNPKFLVSFFLREIA